MSDVSPIPASNAIAPTNATGGADSSPTISLAPQSPAVPPTQNVEAPKNDHEERVQRQIIQMARKERELQKQMAAFKQEQSSLAEERKALAEYNTLKQRAKVDPLAITKHFGIEFKQLTDQVLNDERPTPTALIDELRGKIEQLEGKLSKKDQDEETSRKEQAVNGFKEQIKEFVQGKGDEFELIQAFGMHNQVFDLLYNHFQETGEYASMEEAAKIIESNLEVEARKLQGLKKLSPRQEAKVEAALENKTGEKPVSRTLTNTLASQGAAPPQRPSLMDDEMSIREAAKLLKWNS